MSQGPAASTRLHGAGPQAAAAAAGGKQARSSIMAMRPRCLSLPTLRFRCAPKLAALPAHLEQHAGMALPPCRQLGRDQRQLRQLRPKHAHHRRHHWLALRQRDGWAERVGGAREECVPLAHIRNGKMGVNCRQIRPSPCLEQYCSSPQKGAASGATVRPQPAGCPQLHAPCRPCPPCAAAA